MKLIALLAVLSTSCIHWQRDFNWVLDDDFNHLSDRQFDRKFNRDHAGCVHTSTYMSGRYNSSERVSQNSYVNCMISKGWILDDEST